MLRNEIIEFVLRKSSNVSSEASVGSGEGIVYWIGTAGEVYGNHMTSGSWGNTQHPEVSVLMVVGRKGLDHNNL